MQVSEQQIARDRSEALVACSFTLRDLRTLGFPIEVELGQARINPNKDSMGKGPVHYKVPIDEIYYHRQYGGKLERYGTLMGLPVYSDERLPSNQVVLLSKNGDLVGDCDEVDDLLHKMDRLIA